MSARFLGILAKKLADDLILKVYAFYEFIMQYHATFYLAACYPAKRDPGLRDRGLKAKML
jgi:hypothetical protein